jgi:hypothetical protein
MWPAPSCRPCEVQTRRRGWQGPHAIDGDASRPHDGGAWTGRPKPTCAAEAVRVRRATAQDCQEDRVGFGASTEKRNVLTRSVRHRGTRERSTAIRLLRNAPTHRERPLMRRRFFSFAERAAYCPPRRCYVGRRLRLLSASDKPATLGSCEGARKCARPLPPPKSEQRRIRASFT